MKLVKNKFLIFGALGLLVVIVATSVLIFFNPLKKESAKSFDYYAHQMVVKCKDAPYRPTCYEAEVPKLVAVMPTEDIFSVIRLIRNEDPQYLYCHVLAHELGRYEVSKDPNNWLNVIAKGPTDGLCSNGFAHGAIVTRFNDGELSPNEFDAAMKDLSIACEERKGFSPTPLTKAICYHGIGHVLIHMTLAKVDESLKACEIVGLKDDGRDYRQLCTEGVYMQLFQPLEPEDYALVDLLPLKPTREDLAEFCSKFSANDTQYGACWREGWPFFGDEIYDSKGIESYCSQLSESQDKEMCYQSVFTINGRHNLGDPDKMASVCNGLSLEHQGDCFSRGANAFPEEDPNLVTQGVEMCGRAQSAVAKDQCYTFLASVAAFNFKKDSVPFETLCTTLPKEYENICRGGS